MSVWMELPAGYFDDVQASSYVGLVVANTSPEQQSTTAPVAATIELDVLCTVGDAVDLAATTIYVNGAAAVVGSVFQAGYDGPGSAIAVTGVNLHAAIDPTTDFTSEQLITVRVVSANVGATHTVDYTYTFTVEDTTRPTLVSARATYADVIRITFSEPMLAVSSSGPADALNPALYEFTFLPETDRQAACSAFASSVAMISSTVFDVTTDMELSFWRRYRLTCGDVADDSGNTIQPSYRTADFDSWHPPDWPPNRDVSLWGRLAQYDRDQDQDIGDLERFMDALQDTINITVWRVDQMQYWWDIDRCPAHVLPLHLASRGNPFNFDLTVARQRKLAAVLIDIYKKKGTAEGIIHAVRFFLGIEITEIGAYNLTTWQLGRGQLGSTTVIGPSDAKARYTFTVMVSETLGDADRLIMRRIIEYMRPAHMHYVIVEPESPEFVDHWELGRSKLGTQTILH